MAISDNFSFSSSQSPKDEKGITNYTDCIVTLVWADGVNRTPPLAFTFNNNVTPPAKRTPARVRKYKAAKKAHRDAGISWGRMRAKEGSGTYVKESAEIIRIFIKECEDVVDWSECLIFRDKGKAFLEEGEDVLESLGVGKVVVYPSCVHELLSPNDNKLHGVCKTKWRNSKVSKKLNILATLALLKHLDDVKPGHIRNWWNHNFMLDAKRIKMDACLAIVKGDNERGVEAQKLHDACHREY